MYVCMYACMYVCMYVYMYVCMYVCMYVFVLLCIYSADREIKQFQICLRQAYAELGFAYA